MRPALRVLRACAAVGAAGWLVAPYLGSPAAAADQTVTVGSPSANTFVPATVTINKGDTVTWQYGGGSNHTVTSTTANWDKDVHVGPSTPPAGPFDLTTTYTFTKSGTYRYICQTHQSAGMRGKVVVLGSTPTPTHKPSHTPPSSPPTTSSASPTQTASASASPSGSPTASVTPSTPLPSASVPGQTPGSFSPRPSASRFLGEGGLSRQPPSGRAKGLPFMIALLLIGGVGSAELRALLANAPRY